MGFGGPVWHVSIGWHYDGPVWKTIEEIARLELRGVGDPVAGEWMERGKRAFHLRRRLTSREIREGGIGTVLDVRRTADGAVRIARMRPFLVPAMNEVLEHELSR